MSDTPKVGPFVQLAYFVADAEAAARRWAREFGAGPFFLMEHIPLENAIHRGTPAALDHTSAYGQLGSVMIELIQQHGEYPSVFRDMYAPGDYGLHHMARFARDFDAELARLRGLGYATAMTASTALGSRFAFADATAEFGHMLEVYEDEPGMRGFYAMIANVSQGWDGTDPVRSLG
jgi:hypothetical protein